MSVNKVILVGNLGRDPELKFTANQNPVCTFSVATTERRKDQSGNWTDHTEWHNVVVFGKTAENCANYLKKGRQAYIEGRLQTRKWQDKEGKDRYTTEIIANEVKFLGGGAGKQGGLDKSVEVEGSYDAGMPTTAKASALSSLPSADAISAAVAGAGGTALDDDDIPF